MSQRQKHSKSTRGTQTEDISQVSSANTILIKNPPLRFKSLHPDESTDVVNVVAGSNNNDGHFYNMDTRLVLYQQIEANDDDDIEVNNYQYMYVCMCVCACMCVLRDHTHLSMVFVGFD